MNELIDSPKFSHRAANFFSLCIPKPHSINLAWDIVHIYMIFFISNTIIPSLFNSYTNVNLLTPWLIVGFITQPAYKSYIQLIFASLLLEFNSTVPAGFYLISYFAAATVIIESRSILSWRILTPWAVSFTLAACWIFGLKLLMISYYANSNYYTVGLFMRGVLNILISLILGLWWRQDWKNYAPKE